MAAIWPKADYKTFRKALTDTSKTTCYTVGDDAETFADVVALAICDSTGAVATGATIHVTLGGGDSTEGIIAKPAAAEIANLFTLECLLHMDAGGVIKVTGASGHHVWITIHKGVRSGAAAQNRNT